MTLSNKITNSYSQYQEQFRAMIESFPDGIVVHQHSRVKYLNRQMAEILGASNPENFIGKKIFQYIPAEEHQEITDRLKVIAEYGHIGKNRHTLIKVNGEKITVDSFGSKVIWEGKHAFQAVIRDVSEEVKRKELLDAYKTGFRALFEGMLAGICIFDKNMNIYDCNESFCEMLGYNKKDIISKTFTDFTPDKWLSGESYEIIKQQVRDSGCSDKYIKEYQHRDGSTFPIKGICIRLGPLSSKNTLYCEVACNKSFQQETEIQIETIIDTIAEEILPVINKIKIENKDIKYLDILEERIKSISETKPTDFLKELTPHQREICNLIKQGLSSKEISGLLSLSVRTIHCHRENIRKKLGIVKNKQSLTEFLNEVA